MDDDRSEQESPREPSVKREPSIKRDVSVKQEQQANVAGILGDSDGSTSDAARTAAAPRTQLVVAVGIVLLVVVSYGLWLKSTTYFDGPTSSVVAMQRLKGVAIGVLIYATDSDDVFPLSDGFDDAIFPYVKKKEFFESPHADGGRIEYNSRLAGVSTTRIYSDDSDHVPMLRFPNEWVGKGHAVAFVDGSGRFVPDDKWQSLEQAWLMDRGSPVLRIPEAQASPSSANVPPVKDAQIVVPDPNSKPSSEQSSTSRTASPEPAPSTSAQGSAQPESQSSANDNAVKQPGAK